MFEGKPKEFELGKKKELFTVIKWSCDDMVLRSQDILTALTTGKIRNNINDNTTPV